MKLKKYVITFFTVLVIFFHADYTSSQDNVKSAPVNVEEKIIDYLSLIFTGGVPIVLFAWWLINSQQDKKRLEETQDQNNVIDVKLGEMIKNQQQNFIAHQAHFNDLLSRLESKIDSLSAQFTQEKYETLKKYYEHESKLNGIITDLARNKKIIDNVIEIENYLSLKHDYKIRTYKKEKPLQ